MKYVPSKQEDQDENDEEAVYSTEDIRNINSYISSILWRRRHPRCLLKDLDPSLALGFYIRNKDDFEDFYTRSKALENVLRQNKKEIPFMVDEIEKSYEGMFNDVMTFSGDEEEDDDEDDEKQKDRRRSNSDWEFC